MYILHVLAFHCDRIILLSYIHKRLELAMGTCRLETGTGNNVGQMLYRIVRMSVNNADRRYGYLKSSSPLSPPLSLWPPGLH